MSNNQLETSTNEPTAVKMILDALLFKYPNTFQLFLKEKNLVNQPDRIGAAASVAAMSDCGLNHKQVEKLNRHIHHHANFRPFATKKSIATLSCGAPIPMVTSLELKKPIDDGKDDTDDKNDGENDTTDQTDQSDDDKKFRVEEITVMTHDIIHVMKLYILRDIEDRKNTQHLPMDTHISDSIGCGTLIIVGTDHGQGHSQSLMQCLISSSAERRIANQSEYGTIHIPVSIAECKKEADAITQTASIMADGSCADLDMCIVENQAVLTKARYDL